MLERVLGDGAGRVQRPNQQEDQGAAHDVVVEPASRRCQHDGQSGMSSAERCLLRLSVGFAGRKMSNVKIAATRENVDSLIKEQSSGMRDSSLASRPFELVWTMWKWCCEWTKNGRPEHCHRVQDQSSRCQQSERQEASDLLKAVDARREERTKNEDSEAKGLVEWPTPCLIAPDWRPLPPFPKSKKAGMVITDQQTRPARHPWAITVRDKRWIPQPRPEGQLAG